MHLAQWNTVKDILKQQGLTPDSPNLPISSLLPALKSGVAAAAKRVLVDGEFAWVNATAAIEALYASQVDLTQTTAINLGVAAGDAVIAMRVNDGSTVTIPQFFGKACHTAINEPQILIQTALFINPIPTYTKVTIRHAANGGPLLPCFNPLPCLNGAMSRLGHWRPPPSSASHRRRTTRSRLSTNKLTTKACALAARSRLSARRRRR